MFKKLKDKFLNFYHTTYGMLITVSWVVLIACLIIKLFGGNWFALESKNSKFNDFCIFVDNTQWLKMILACIIYIVTSLYFWDISLNTPNKYALGGTFEDTAAINALESNKANKLTGNKKIYATDSLGAETSLDYDVLPTGETIPIRQTDGTIQVGTPTEDTDAANKAYVDSNKTDAMDLLALIDNPYEGLVIDLTETGNKIEIHLDGVDVQKELVVKRYSANKQMVTLDDGEVQLLRGLRVWIEFQYNGTLMTKCQDIRFVKGVQTNAVIDLGEPIPNPAIFSDMIIAQYNHNTSELSLQTTGSGIPSIIKIIDVKGIA